MRRLLLAYSLSFGPVLGAGCASHARPGPTTPEQAEFSEEDQQEAENERELRAQLALARSQVATLEAQRGGPAVDTEREVVRIAPSDPPSFFEDDAGGWDEPAEQLPEVAEPEPEAPAPDSPRPVLRLYGTAEPIAYAPLAPMMPTPVVAPPSGDRLPWETAPRAASLMAVPPVAQAPQRIDLGLESYREALGLLRDRRFTESESAFARFLEVFPRHPQVSQARYWIAELAYIQRRYEDALRAFDSYLGVFPNGSKAPDALLRLGLCHRQLGQTQQASTTLARLRREHPESDAARLAAREVSR